jgi:hypothetical protein
MKWFYPHGEQCDAAFLQARGSLLAQKSNKSHDKASVLLLYLMLSIARCLELLGDIPSFEPGSLYNVTIVVKWPDSKM